MSVALSIAFTGLCALIGGGDGKPGEILLVDAKGVGQIGGISLPVHSPTLVVSMNDLANPDSSGPTRIVAGRPDRNGRVDQLGIWDLTGTEIRIRAEGNPGAGVQFFRPAKDETSWPEPPTSDNPASWRDLRFVPSMSALVGDGRVDPLLLGGGDRPRSLPSSVAARVHLDSGLLEGAIPSQETYRDDAFEFRGGRSGRVLRQAVTDTIRWTVTSEASAVVIDITPVDGGPTRRLLLAPSATPHAVFVSNLPAENAAHPHHEMSDDEMSALHFGAYYKMLLHEPTDWLLPSLSQPEGRRGSGLVRPMFCPPAVFSRQ